MLPFDELPRSYSALGLHPAARAMQRRRMLNPADESFTEEGPCMPPYTTCNHWEAPVYGACLLVLGLVLLVAGYWSQRRYRNRISTACFTLPPENRLLTILIFVITAFNFVMVFTRVSYLTYNAASSNSQHLYLLMHYNNVYVTIVTFTYWLAKMRGVFYHKFRMKRGSRNWTIASSQDVFSESTEAIWLEQAYIFLIVCILGIASIILLTDFKKLDQGDFSELFDTVDRANYILLIYLFVVTIFLPDAVLTNAAVAEALRLQGNKQLMRMRVCHWLTLAVLPSSIFTYNPRSWDIGAIPSAVPPVVFAACCVAWQLSNHLLHSESRHRMGFNSRKDKAASLIWTLVLPVVFAGLSVWISLEGSKSSGHNHKAGAILSLAAKLAALVWLWPVNLPAASRFFALFCGRSHLLSGLAIKSSSTQSGIVRTRRLFLFMLLLFHHIRNGNSWSLHIMLAMKYAGVVVLAFLQEEETSFYGEDPQELESLCQAPGFGLVVSAYDLEAALALELNNRRQQAEETGDGAAANISLRLYKASLFRMDQTLAVSYRWQPHVRTIATSSRTGAAVAVNLSTWQLTQLLEGIRATRLRYVWLDVLSVPQPPLDGPAAPLQQTLLARMMGVYVAAARTLVLKSLERDTGRYHQRAWTFQEFCAARHVRVALEAPVEAGCTRCSQTMCCCTTEEVKTMEEMRSLIQGSMPDCRPLWIVIMRAHMANSGQSMSASDVMSCENFLEHVKDLKCRAKLHSDMCTKLHCQEEEDRVRALLPLLLNSPVEKHEELVELVRLVRRLQPAEPLGDDELFAGITSVVVAPVLLRWNSTLV